MHECALVLPGGMHGSPPSKHTHAHPCHSTIAPPPLPPTAPAAPEEAPSPTPEQLFAGQVGTSLLEMGTSRSLRRCVMVEV